MKSIKLLFSIFLLLGIGLPLNAQTSFLPLPFDIEIGVTRNEEIENRGTCLERIQASEYYFRCAKYSIQDRFTVYSSQNEIVTKLEFLSTVGHSLPRDWTASGLKMGPLNQEGLNGFGEFSYFSKNCETGTSADEIIAILQSKSIPFEVIDNNADVRVAGLRECGLSMPQYKDITNPEHKGTTANTLISPSYGGNWRLKSDIITIKEIRFSVNGRLYHIKTAQWYHNFSTMIDAPTIQQVRSYSNVLPFFQKGLGILEISVTEDY